MEHSCYRCGATVEEGVAFCPQCKAPQIRVAVVENTADSGAAPEVAPASHARSDSPPAAIQWSRALPASVLAVVASLLIIVLGAPLGLGVLVAGFLSVILYRRRDPATRLTPGLGARLGALSGLLGFGFLAISLAAIAAFRSGAQIHQAVLEFTQRYVARTSNPQTQEALKLLQSPEGFALMIIIGSIMTLVLFLTLSALGGALSAVLLRRKDDR